jgi:hypothetical protein
VSIEAADIETMSAASLVGVKRGPGVIASHSRSKNGVASLAYGEAIQPRAGRREKNAEDAAIAAPFVGALRAQLDCFVAFGSSQ